MYTPRSGLLVNSLSRMSDSLIVVEQPENLRGCRKTGERERVTGGRMASIKSRVIWTSETEEAVHFASIALTRTA